MAAPAARAWVLLALALAAPLCLHAKIEHAWVDTDDRPLIPLSEAFGFGERGHIDIVLTDIAIFRRHDAGGSEINADSFGLFLAPTDAAMALEQDQAAGKCMLQDRDNVLFTFKDPGVQKLVSAVASNFTYHVEVENGGWYTLYFANCDEQTPISFATRLELYNLQPNGRKDFLSIGQTELAVVFWVAFAMFAGLTITWGLVLHRGHGSVQRIHWLMLVLLVFKALTCLAQALMYHMIEIMGTAEGWNIAYYVFTFFRGLLFFTVLVLIGTGWSYMKPFIDDRTRNILYVVVPLQVFANLAIIITNEESPAGRDFFTWRDLLHVVDIACCCAVLFPIVWSIRQLSEASQTDGKAARSLEKLRLFRQLYISLVVYVYFTRIVVFLLQATLEYQYFWVATAAGELATLAFYVWVGVNFRPHQDNRYFKLTDEELREVEL